MADSLRNYLSQIKCPGLDDKVHKDECAFSFDTPECETGLYICMRTFLGLGERHVQRYYERTSNGCFLHIRTLKRRLPPPPADAEIQPTKLAIGVEGGFATDECLYEYEHEHAIVLLPQWERIPLTEDLPDLVNICVASIVSAESASKVDDIAALQNTWDGEERKISKHAENLIQLNNGVRVPPSGWQCAMCDKKDNLWLNLTDGTILCGRKFFDGSGGNNHAVEHYQNTRYPLAVKLGTITPNGGGGSPVFKAEMDSRMNHFEFLEKKESFDIYSYDEDDMVLDPNLGQHLEHFGINITQMEKTEKTMIELEIDLNQRQQEWDLIQESGKPLKPLYGPGFTGIHNLGNSCYLNSVVQVLFAIPEFQKRYADRCQEIFNRAPQDPTTDFTVQMAKFGQGLLSGDYSKLPVNNDAQVAGVERPILYQTGIRPLMFRALIGRGHPEFATKRQQDAQEFLLHLLDMIEKTSRAPGDNCCECLRHRVEERIECATSHQVNYTERDDYLLALRIPIEAAANQADVDAYLSAKAAVESEGGRFCHETPLDDALSVWRFRESTHGESLPIDFNILMKSPFLSWEPSQPIVRPKFRFADLIDSFLQTETVQDFYSSAINGKTNAFKTTRLATFPDYLFIQLKKFTIGDDWLPKKLDVSVDMPDEIDLSKLRGRGLLPSEVQLPQGASEPGFHLNESYVCQLVEMGFPMSACKKAVYHTNNTGVEDAMNWLMQHMDDPDFSAPFEPPPQKKTRTFHNVSDEHVQTIMGMGFNSQQAAMALRKTIQSIHYLSHDDKSKIFEMEITSYYQENNLERAVDYIFTHADELENDVIMEEAGCARPEGRCRDGNERYRLLAFISHMGTSSMVGHYVCHIRRDGEWVIFNDEKVSLSERPPKDLGYLYLYQRI